MFPNFSENEEEIVPLACYHVLTNLRIHWKVMPKRTLDEIWAVNFNPHMSLATFGNHEAELVCHTPALSNITKGSGSKEALCTASDKADK